MCRESGAGVPVRTVGFLPFEAQPSYSPEALFRRLKKPGLRVALFVTFTLALAFVLGALHLSISWMVSDFLETRFLDHGHAKAQELASILAHPESDTQAMRAVGGLAESDKDFTYAAFVSGTGEVLLDGGERPERLESLLSRVSQPGAPTSLEIPNGDVLVTQAVQTSPGELTPRRVVVVVDSSPLRDMLRKLTILLVAALIIGLVLVMGLIFVVTHVLILRPLDRMMAVARKMAEGDLTGRVAMEDGGEMGQLAQALDGIGQSLRKTLGQVRGVSEVVSNVIEQLSRAGTTVSSGASTIQGRVEETSSSMEEMLASLRGIAENVEVLYQSAEESSSSIMEMAATNDEVAENVQAMAASVEETTSAIEEMTFSIKEVAKNIDELRDSTEETSSSISQMDSSIGQVEANANETARLSEQVSEDAQTGVEALRKTMLGLERIKGSSQTASGVIDSLGRRISEIGNILNVIDDVAEQTNLLALNAAIIAAQSGEHGKGFAVVADEIKDLAERTGASTKEIADLISRVQDESRNAVQVMNQGVRNAEEGVQLGREAEGTLRKINDSAQKSTQMVKAIARATVEQARGSKQVTQAIHRISETVQHDLQGLQRAGQGRRADHEERRADEGHHRARAAQQPGAGARQQADHPLHREHQRDGHPPQPCPEGADQGQRAGAQGGGGHQGRVGPPDALGEGAGRGHRQPAAAVRSASRREPAFQGMRRLMSSRAISERAVVFLIGAVQFVNILDFVMVMPLGPDFAAGLGIATSHIGTIGGGLHGGGVRGGVAGSYFLDRFDRRKALAVAMLGLVVSTAAGGLATGLTTLLLARAVAGLFGGPATSLSLSIIADLIPPERRGRAMGAVMGAFSVASVLGVPLALKVARVG